MLTDGSTTRPSRRPPSKPALNPKLKDLARAVVALPANQRSASTQALIQANKERMAGPGRYSFDPKAQSRLERRVKKLYTEAVRKPSIWAAGTAPKEATTRSRRKSLPEQTLGAVKGGIKTWLGRN